jgi:hypothetical protein
LFWSRWRPASVLFHAYWTGQFDRQSIKDTLPGVGKFDANTGVASHANFR